MPHVYLPVPPRPPVVVQLQRIQISKIRIPSTYSNFGKNLEDGINSTDFTVLMVESGLLFNGDYVWITFHSAYDLAHLIKIMTPHRKLPFDLVQFMHVVHFTFGSRFYDLKHMKKFCDGRTSTSKKEARMD